MNAGSVDIVIPAQETSRSRARSLGFKRHLRAEIREGDGAYLFSENGVITLRGAAIAELAPLLDGSCDLPTVLRRRPAGMSEQQVLDLLSRLTEAGLVTERAAAGIDEHVLAYWDACGVDVDEVHTMAQVELIAVGAGIDTTAMALAMKATGINVVSDGESAMETDLSVVLCADYLDPRLGEIDAAHRAKGRPWLLAKPVGTQVWLGPIVRPGLSACWHCLAERLSGNRRAEVCIQNLLGHTGPASRPLPALSSSTAVIAGLVTLEVTKWLSGYRYHGQDCVWTLNTVDLRGQSHELRRRPQCGTCGEPSLVAKRTAEPIVLAQAKKTSCNGGGHRTLSQEQMLDSYRHLVSPVTGIIKEIRRDPRVPEFVNAYRSGPNMVHALGGIAELRASMRAENGGKGATAIDAEVGALCEAVERYSGCFHGDELRITDSYDKLGDLAIHPNSCMLFDERQYMSRRTWNPAHGSFQHIPVPFDERAELDWTPLWSLSERRQRLLPTGYLYFGASAAVGGREYLRADSNGNAAGSSMEDAVLQGLLELIERDAVALWWYNRTPLSGVDLTGFGDSWIADMPAQYRRIGRELWAIDLTADLGVPVMAAISRRIGTDDEQVMLGFGAHLDPCIALRRAVSELNQLLPWVCGDIDKLDDKDALAWLRNASVANQSYLLPKAGASARSLGDFDYVYRDDVLEDVTWLVEILAEHGLETLVLDQTRPDTGLPVVKTVVPGLRPFWSRFAPGRLFDVPVRLGRLTTPTLYARLNPLPMFL